MKILAETTHAEQEPRVPEDVIELSLCEQNFLVLRPGVLYRLTAREGCAECEKILRIFEGAP